MFLGLSQDAYIQRILECFQMQSCKPVNTPIEKSTKLTMGMCPSSDAEKDRMRHVPYACAVGSLMHAMRFTCPDLA